MRVTVVNPTLHTVWALHAYSEVYEQSRAGAPALHIHVYFCGAYFRG
jgi:hypothetical protein